jgi:hypothetical protein
LVYCRDESVSFKVDAAPVDLAIDGAVVNNGESSITTDTSGSYEFSDLTPGFHTITVAADGYIPSQISWDFLAGQSYIFNIGLYKAPSAINSRPGFVNGIATWDAGGSITDYYFPRGLFQPTYTNAAHNAGAGLVTFSDPVFCKVLDDDHVEMSTLHDEWWRMLNEDEYSVLVQDAHDKGMQFMLWLGLMDNNDPYYWEIVYRDGARSALFWDSWFAEYEKYAVVYAEMAERLGIEYLNLGHDMDYATGSFRYNGGEVDCLAHWQRLVEAIRAVYHGKLTYFGGTSVVDDYYEDSGYPAGFPALFDAIGINVQAITPVFNPSTDQLKSAVTTLLNRYTSWSCPLFVLLLTPSVDGGTSFSTYIEPLLPVNREADNHTLNLFQQADIYAAFYEVVNDRPVGKGEVMGLFSWGYNYLDNYFYIPEQADGETAMDKSGNIRGKPAEYLMKFWSFR